MKPLSAILLTLTFLTSPLWAQSNIGGSGSGVTITTVGNLANVPGKTKGTVAAVTDGNSATDCTTGSGSTTVLCQFNGATWSAVSSGGGGGGAWSGITAGANANTLTETTAGSLVPAQTASTTGLGQITGLTNWFTIAPTAVFPLEPTLTSSNTGGSLVQSVYFFKVTYVGLSVTVPSGEVRGQLNATNCASNSTCQITVTMPTTCTAGNLPSGVTGCTVWDSTTTGTEKQQAASNACVNITTATCVVNTLAAGSSLSIPTSTGVTPPNLQAQTISDQIIPAGYMIKDNGLAYPEYGLDVSALNILTDQFIGATPPAWAGGANGTMTWTDRFFVSDKTGAPISNALVSINHESGNATGTLTSAGIGIDDRALTIRIDNDVTSKPNYEQYLGEYAETFLDNNSMTCSPIAPENCAAGVRGVVADFRTAGTLAVTNVMAGVAGTAFREATNVATPWSNCNPCMAGIAGIGSNLSNNGLGGQFMAGGVFGAGDASGGAASAGLGTAVYLLNPGAQSGGGRFSTANIGIYANNSWSNTSTSDLILRLDGATPSRIKGLFELYSLASYSGAMSMTGGLNSEGITTTQLANTVLNGQTVTNGGAAGAVTDTYKFVYKDAAGGTVPQTGAGTSNTTANANLTATNFNNVNFAPNGLASNLCSLGISSIDIYRTANASQCNGIACTTGKIGNFPITDCTNQFTSQTFVDNGIQGDSSSFPATPNQTGAIQAFEYNTNTNCAVNTVSPAACGSAAAGAVVIPASQTTYVINTTAVTAASRIQLTWLTFASNLPSSPTCVAPSTTTMPTISAISPGVSFTIALTSIASQTCPMYTIFN